MDEAYAEFGSCSPGRHFTEPGYALDATTDVISERFVSRRRGDNMVGEFGEEEAENFRYESFVSR